MKSNLGLNGYLLIAAALLGVGTQAPAAKLAEVFTDHMVLQRDLPVPVWGTAKPGSSVSVDFAGQHKTASVGPDGKWMVKLDPFAASSEGRELTVAEAGEKAIIQDVLVGEVWVGLGGSNMQQSAEELLVWANPKIARFKQEPQIKVEKQVQSDLAAATDQRIRFLVIGQPILLRDRPEFKTWQVCSPASAQQVSFLGYCFARELARDQNVPVGFITAAAKSSRIDSWLSTEALQSSDFFKGNPMTTGTKGLQPVESNYRVCVKPLLPMALRGLLWHQGEQDIQFATSPGIYGKKLELVVQNLRKAWGREDLPFYCGQLSASRIYGRPESGSEMSVELVPAYQEAQRRTSNLPHTGLVVTSDLTDDTANPTPVNKWDMARRFWLWAAHDCYGKKEVVPSGPMFQGMEVKGGKAILRFKYCGGGLKGLENKPLRYFQLAGSNGAYYPAQASIEGNTVVISNPAVKNPVQVRYAWHQTAPLSLGNKEGLPASVFTSEAQVPEKLGIMAGNLPDAGIVKQQIPDKTVVLTFDDACLSQLTFVAPVLKKYGFGGTFFVCEYPVKPTENRDELYLTWPQMKELNEMGFEIGNHSFNHPPSLASLPRDQIIQEIAAVEESCAKYGIPKPVSFAYPNYSSSEEMMNILRDRGYVWGRSGGTLYDPKSDHSLMVPCVILPNRPLEKSLQVLRENIEKARDGKVLLLLFHGVPDKPHPWVTFEPETFESCMQVLKETGCKVIAMRDLSRFIDSKRAMDYFQPIWR